MITEKDIGKEVYQVNYYNKKESSGIVKLVNGDEFVRLNHGALFVSKTKDYVTEDQFPKPGEGYRLLENGEPIQEGDEFYSFYNGWNLSVSTKQDNCFLYRRAWTPSVGEWVRINKPKNNNRINWVEEMDYLDGKIVKITEKARIFEKVFVINIDNRIVEEEWCSQVRQPPDWIPDNYYVIDDPEEDIVPGCVVIDNKNSNNALFVRKDSDIRKKKFYPSMAVIISPSQKVYK